ncbi:MAG TPA: acireductone dioxygenase [Turneriella sp.]|nr:acireductone dioxygenase [Turneriella sp.]
MQTTLTIYSEKNPNEKEEVIQEFGKIKDLLATQRIGFERWQAEKPLSEKATPEEVADAYRTSIDKILSQGYKTFDVVSLYPDAPNAAEARKKFLSEHTHGEDEVRFFVDGSGMFYVHADGKVFMLLCTKGDFISLPAGTTHWFDMGPKPFFKAIRVFNNPEGWVGHFTGSRIADQFPKYE